LQLSGVVEQNFSLPALVTSFIAFATSESIRFLLFRQKLDENFQRFTEAKIIGSASDFFHDLLAAFNNNATASAEVCYFTQQPPTDFYHLSHVKKYWEEMLVTLKKNKNKSLLRLVLLTNPAMFGWLEKHIEEHKGLSNYYLNVITEKEDHQFLSLCLTSNQECYIFSPHAPDQSPSYIWIKNEVIHHTLKTAYDRMWASGKRVLIQGRVNNDVINELRTQFMNISNNNFERKD
jgi:hypothetical protein